MPMEVDRRQFLQIAGASATALALGPVGAAAPGRIEKVGQSQTEIELFDVQCGFGGMTPGDPKIVNVEELVAEMARLRIGSGLMTARNASSSPMSLIATFGVALEIGVASMLAVMKGWLRGWTGVVCGQVSAGRADGPVSTCRDPGPLTTCRHEGGEDRLTERGLLRPRSRRPTSAPGSLRSGVITGQRGGHA